MFMKSPKRTKKGTGRSPQEHEEHVSSIIASLFRNVQGNGRERMIGKFVENDHEKVDRLMELHFSYLQKVCVCVCVCVCVHMVLLAQDVHCK